MPRLEDLLYTIDKPSRYLGGEINQILKDPDTVKMRFALAFPDTYEIGMSYAGFKILYAILNKMEGVWAQRVFAPWSDMADLLEQQDLPLFSLEEKRPLNEFDVVGFSVPYELSYTTIIRMLKLSKIPVQRQDRSSSDPLVIAGGTCTSNPTPLLDIFDLIVIGDGEEVVKEIAQICMKTKDRKERIIAASSLEGVFAPSISKSVRRRIVKDLDVYPFPEATIVANTPIVHDRIGVEVSRGCTRGCRFCQAGMLYRPYRERSFGSVINSFNQSLHLTGYDDISLICLSATDLSYIDPLIESLSNPLRETSIGVPSLRVEGLEKSSIDLIASSKKSGVTLAPEAATNRLRQVINKGNTEEDLLKNIETLKKFGWQSVKLYFMVGLPTETQEDVEAICELSKKISRDLRVRVTVSISAFMPKPFTPFQWESQLSMKEHLSILDYLKTRLRQKNISLKWQEPSMTFLEGLFARGDERLMPVLLDACQSGAYLDAWGDKLNLNIWTDALERHSIDPGLYFNERDTEKPLPWDFIDMRIDKAFLLEERKKAYKGISTSDCRYDACSNCGACAGDIKNLIQPKAEVIRLFEKTEKAKEHFFYTIGITKQGDLRFIGARQWAELVKRALRRANLPVHYSEGFSPDIKISFVPPLSFGIPSLSEYFQIDLKERMEPQKIIEQLNTHLNEGAKVFSCAETKLPAIEAYVFRLEKPLNMPIDMNTAIKKGEELLRIGDFLASSDGTDMKIRFINGKTISPSLILDAVCAKVAPNEITKIETVFADVQQNAGHQDINMIT